MVVKHVMAQIAINVHLALTGIIKKHHQINAPNVMNLALLHVIQAEIQTVKANVQMDIILKQTMV